MLRRWLNSGGNSQRNEKYQEDPSEDVFIGNVATTSGNFRIFTGLWTDSDYHLEVFITCLAELGLKKSLYIRIWKSTIGLLLLSETLAHRLNLGRWTAEDSQAKRPIRLPNDAKLKKHVHALVFSPTDLTDLGITDAHLEPFLLCVNDNSLISNEDKISTYLENTPLMRMGNDICLISPHDISPAIRNHIISQLSDDDRDKFRRAIAKYHAHQLQSQILRGLKYDTAPLDQPESSTQLPPLTSWLLRYDTNKAIHVVLLHDPLSRISNGFHSTLTYTARQDRGLQTFLADVAQYCLTDLEYQEGLTLIVAGGIGRSIEIPSYEAPQKWHKSIITLFDAILLSDRHSQSIDRYIKFVRYRHGVELSGIRFPRLWSDVDLFSYWVNNDFNLIPSGEYIRDYDRVITPLCSLKLRLECRLASDRHVAMSIEGDWHKMIRFTTDSYFASRGTIPTYISLDLLMTRGLAGLSITDRGVCWLRAIGCHESEPLREIEFHIWEVLLDLLFVMKRHIDESTNCLAKAPVEVQLDFSSMVLPTDGPSVAHKTGSHFSDVHVDMDRRVVHLKFHKDALKNMMTPDDSVDREIITELIRALLCVYQYDDLLSIESRSVQICSNLLGDYQIRLVHLFPIDSRASVIGKNWREPFLVCEEDLAAAQQKMSKKQELRKYANKTLKTVDDCNDFLRSVVDYYWHQIQATLNQIDRNSLIRILLRFHDIIVDDRLRWRIASRSIMGMHGSEEEPIRAAQTREAHRARTSLAIRTLLEMAICECPYRSEQQVPRSVVEQLIAEACLMLRVATESDGIFTGLVEPEIEVVSDLSYSMSRQFFRDIHNKYSSAQFASEFRSDVAGYERWYQSMDPDASLSELPREWIACSDALCHEFGLSLDNMFTGVRALVAFAQNLEEDVVSSSVGGLRKWITEDGRYPAEIVNTTIQSLGIFHRTRWDKAPRGFSMRDINPWRYSRRLSFVFRPILIDGLTPDCHLYYSVNGIVMGLSTLVSRLIDGHLAQEFATSREMRSYLGGVDSQKGSEFEEQIAAEFKSRSWHVRTRVAMSEFGANGDLGDVDVLAWRSSGLLMVIECKRLKLARTVKEIAETCQRFADDESGQAQKHAARVAWIRQYPLKACVVAGLSLDSLRIRPRFVTNVEVPMKYLNVLPQDLGDIGPLTAEELLEE